MAGIDANQGGRLLRKGTKQPEAYHTRAGRAKQAFRDAKEVR